MRGQRRRSPCRDTQHTSQPCSPPRPTAHPAPRPPGDPHGSWGAKRPQHRPAPSRGPTPSAPAPPLLPPAPHAPQAAPGPPPGLTDPGTWARPGLGALSRHGTAPIGSVRCGSARHGTAPIGTARLGTARLCSAHPRPAVTQRAGPGGAEQHRVPPRPSGTPGGVAAPPASGSGTRSLQPGSVGGGPSGLAPEGARLGRPGAGLPPSQHLAAPGTAQGLAGVQRRKGVVWLAGCTLGCKRD